MVPALAQTAAHVTMVQRTPSYIVARPARDSIARGLQRWLPASLADPLVRWKNVLLTMFSFWQARKRPRKFSDWIMGQLRKALPADHPVERDFQPPYDPWDQRLCLVPDGDLFRALRSGRAAIATGEIECFTPTGVRPVDGEELPAELIVTATGLALEAFGGAAISVDGTPVDWPRSLNYKGAMFSDVPNLVSVFGYSKASWTLKSDLIAEYVCRLLRHMARSGMRQATPRNADPEVAGAPWLDLSSGYVQRSLHLFPQQGSKPPWQLQQNYLRDLLSLRWSRVDDGVLVFSNPGPARGARRAVESAAVAD